MMHSIKFGRKTFIASAIFCFTFCLAVPEAESAKPSRPWKGIVEGTGEFSEFVTDDVGDVIGRLDLDTVVGKSTHLGRFTVTPETGFHTLSFEDLTFAGQAKWRAANGDELHVFYEGFSFENPDPDTNEQFPIAAIAIFTADGGTGRFSEASGSMLANGAFTFPATPVDPIDYFFDFDGELSY
jgi:hypothetical protein